MIKDRFINIGDNNERSLGFNDFFEKHVITKRNIKFFIILGILILNVFMLVAIVGNSNVSSVQYNQKVKSNTTLYNKYHFPSYLLNYDNYSLNFSTYFGIGYYGAGMISRGNSIAVDTHGNTYITGSTSSKSFPMKNAYNSTYGGGPYDGFVAKFNSSGSLVFSTYLGGYAVYSLGIAADANGNSYITGATYSGDFPIKNAYQSVYTGGPDAFIVKFNSTGSLMFSTFLGGGGSNEGLGITVGPNDNIYVTGYTTSSNFPMKNAYNATYDGGNSDAFVTELNSTGSLIYSTYLGGSYSGGNVADAGCGIAVDTNSSIYVTGMTASRDFPLKNAYQSTYGVGYSYNAFIAKFNSSGSLIFSTYFYTGGSDTEGYGIAVDTTGNSYITGRGGYVAKFNSSGSLVFNTSFGGLNYGIAVDSNGNSYITIGGGNVVIAKFDPMGTFLLSKSIVASYDDEGYGIAVDTNGSIYVTGITDSGDFPVINAYQSTFAGYVDSDYDVFITKFSPQPISAPLISSPSNLTYQQGSTGNIITWVPTGMYSSIYNIYRNNTLISSGNWSSGVAITINIDGLAVGTYNYTISVNNTFDKSVSDTVIVTVQDTTAPVVTHPTDISYVQGSTGNNISWTATDYNPNTYTIYRNGTLVSSGGWSSGVAITINIDGLAVGTYNYTIRVNDSYSNKAIDTVIVLVQSIPISTITSPSNLTYQQGSTGNIITWVPTGMYSSIYNIYRNNTLISSGSWSSGVAITINIDGLAVGTYNYTISVNNTFDKSVSDTVIVTVQDTTAPVVSHPADISYVQGSTSNNISWTATDYNPNTYTIYRNGTLVSSGGWSSGVAITINIDGLAVGTYNYTIRVSDTSGNKAIDTVYVTITNIGTSTQSTTSINSQVLSSSINQSTQSSLQLTSTPSFELYSILALAGVIFKRKYLKKHK